MTRPKGETDTVEFPQTEADLLRDYDRDAIRARLSWWLENDIVGAGGTERQIEMIARVLFMRYYINRDDASLEWCEAYWDRCSNVEHKGDCPIAELKGPITCDRCVCDEFRDDARAVLEALSNPETGV